MSSISGFEHKAFLQSLDRFIIRFQTLNGEEPLVSAALSNLRTEKEFLETLFAECDDKTQELKKLISGYQQVKQKTRLELRALEILCRQRNRSDRSGTN